MHQDLKLENFLFDSEEEDAALKAMDFGLSVFYKPEHCGVDGVGSEYWWSNDEAPEFVLLNKETELDPEDSSKP
ncbi:hypothetical protein ACFX1T_008258 [Malus domestica]